MLRIAKYVLGITLAANQLANALMGGSPTETVSSRAAHARDQGSRLGRAVCAALDRVDLHHERDGEDHCAKAIRHRRERLAKERQ
jgi:hypothetical protein